MKSKDKISVMQNLSFFFHWGEKNIDFLRDYSLLISQVKNEAKYRGLKILTPKQILKILPIAFAQVKVGKTSENLLNEISQVIYLLYQTKEITKKVYNKIMNSIKL